MFMANKGKGINYATPMTTSRNQAHCLKGQGGLPIGVPLITPV